MTTRKALMDQRSCQVHYLVPMAEPAGVLETLWGRRGRLKRIMKAGFRYLIARLSRMFRRGGASGERARGEQAAGLQAGDRVRVRSREEIEATLDLRGRVNRCGFLDEMWAYCGTEQEVLKPVKRIIDERDHSPKRCKHMVLLKNVTCEGTNDYGACDRTCHFFWRDEWLEKIA